jgi:hypothetical protein
MTWATEFGASGRPSAEATGSFLRFFEDVMDFSVFLSVPVMLHPGMLRGLGQGQSTDRSDFQVVAGQMGFYRTPQTSVFPAISPL